jgi:arylsulfatase A-like enzyme
MIAVSDQPNLLIVLFDQLRYDVADRSDLCDTPNLDRLRREGTWFEQHYTPTCLCSPARASLMTGLYAHNHGVLNNVHSKMAVVHDLSSDHPTLGELLAEAGYRTGYVGKWHLGTARGASQRGFEDVRFPEGDQDPRLAAALEDYVDSMVYTRTRHDKGHKFALYLREAVPPSLVPAHLAFQEAVGLLEGYAGRRGGPFCLVVSFPEPHHPTILTREFIDRYDPATIPPWPSFDDTYENKPRSNEAVLHHYGVAGFTWDDWAPVVARYLGTVTMLDDLLGQLLAELDQRKLAEDTMVIVTADHGDMLGNHRQFNKGPLMYDDIYRIPLLVRPPGAPWRGAGQRIPELTSHLDVLPTVTEIAHAALPPRLRDSATLTPWLAGEQPPGWRTSLMCEFHGDEFGLYSQRMIRRGPHKLVYNPNDLRELYDLAADPHELHNLAYDGTLSGLRAGLENELLELMRGSGDGLAEFASTTLG